MTPRLTLAFALVVLALSLTWVRLARAESAVFASGDGRAAELVPELMLTLRGHGLLLLVRGLGDARTPLERAAAAQRIGRNVGTGVAFWVEHEPPARVRAVGMSGEQIFEAPLPAPLETVEPRVFASVVTSVLLEALGRDETRASMPPLGGTSGESSSVAAAPETGLRVQAEPVGLPWPDGSPPSRPSSPPRFFLRAGVALGFTFVNKGARADRHPSLDLLNDVARRSFSDGSLDLALARQELATAGFDCRTAQQRDGRLSVDRCGVAVNPGGTVSVFALDLAAGARIARRLALSLTARIAPDAGQGTLAHALFGLQLEGALLEPRPTGFWLNALVGVGLGQIQAQPPAPAAAQGDAPYATSGLANVRAGLQLGYRLTEHVGLYVGPVLHVGLPDPLYTLESSLGLEARL